MADSGSPRKGTGSRQVAEAVDETPQSSLPPETTPALLWWQRDREAVIDELLDRLGEGETLASLCKAPGLPPIGVVKRWRKADPELEERFAHARAEFWDAVAEDVIDICDGRRSAPGTSVERDKLRAWGRMQLLARLDNRAAAKAKEPKNPADYVPPEVRFIGVEPYRPPAIEGESARVDPETEADDELEPL